jgi:hypothetical protein
MATKAMPRNYACSDDLLGYRNYSPHRATERAGMCSSIKSANEIFSPISFYLAYAGIAQLVEQLICNQQVVGSNPSAGSLHIRLASSALLEMIF